MSNVQFKLASTIAVLSCGLITGSAAGAQLIQMDFTANFDSFGSDTQISDAFVTVTGSVTWESQASSFSTNGVNSRSWAYTSFDAIGEGWMVTESGTGFNINFTASTGATNHSNSIQTVHSPASTASNMHWRNNNIEPPSGIANASFTVQSFDVAAMPSFTSPLPSSPGDYYGSIPFSATYELLDVDGVSYILYTNSIQVDITAVPAPGATALFGLAGLVTTRRRRS